MRFGEGSGGQVQRNQEFFAQLRLGAWAERPGHRHVLFLY